MPLRILVKGLEALMIMSNDVQLKFFLLTITGHGNRIMFKVRGRMWL